MKVNPALCLALAATAQAFPALEVINQIANILTIITSTISLSTPAVNSQVGLSVAIGYNGVNDKNEVVGGPGTSSGMDGPFPLVYISADDRSSVISYTYGPYINSGDKAVRQTNIKSNRNHLKANIYAGDYKLVGTGNTFYIRNAICFKYIAVTPDSAQSDTKPYVISAELLIKYFNAPWYYSGDNYRYYSDDGKCDIRRSPLPCVWLSAFNHEGLNFIEKISINNVAEYKMAVKTSPMNDATIRSYLSVEMSHLPDKASVYVGGGRPPGLPKRADKEKDDSVIIDSDLPASTLCNDKSSYGPSFVSESEKLFCHMKTKKLYRQCGGKVTSSCYQIKNNTLTLELDAPRRNGIAPPAKISLPLRRFPKNKVAKRADLEEPDCKRNDPILSWTPTITGSYRGDQVAQGSDFDRINQCLRWMNEGSAKNFEGVWVDYQNGHDARFECKKALVQDLTGCQRCIKFATDSALSVLQSRTVGRLDLNCGSIQYSLKRGGSGGGGSKCTRRLGRGDGRSGECCETSDDCVLVCDNGAKKCRPGSTVCGSLNPFKYGRGKGDGVPGDCCESSSDCVKSCVNKQCSSTSSGGGGGGGKCTRKLGRGDGRTGDCCESSNDCELICDNSAKKCRPGSVVCGTLNPFKFGRGKGDGVIGDCCDTSNDCVKSCVNRQCNSSSSGSSGKCSGGRPGLKDGSGAEGACCVTQADCKVCCSKAGVCNAACRD